MMYWTTKHKGNEQILRVPLYSEEIVKKSKKLFTSHVALTDHTTEVKNNVNMKKT